MLTWEQFLAEQLLLEKQKHYSFSSTQFNFPTVISKQIIEWGKKNIPQKNLYIDPTGRLRPGNRDSCYGSIWFAH